MLLLRRNNCVLFLMTTNLLCTIRYASSIVLYYFAAPTHTYIPGMISRPHSHKQELSPLAYKQTHCCTKTCRSSRWPSRLTGAGGRLGPSMWHLFPDSTSERPHCHCLMRDTSLMMRHGCIFRRGHRRADDDELPKKISTPNEKAVQN